VKVKIKRTPVETEIDGVKLSTLIPGLTRDVPSTLALWLIAKGYAQHEMRAEARRTPPKASAPGQSTSNDFQRRMLSDRRSRRW
jgi:hypothetical protein